MKRDIQGNLPIGDSPMMWSPANENALIPPAGELLKFAQRGWEEGKTKKPATEGIDLCHWLLDFNMLLNDPNGIDRIREYATSGARHLKAPDSLIICIHRSFDHSDMGEWLHDMIKAQIKQAVIESKGGYLC